MAGAWKGGSQDIIQFDHVTKDATDAQLETGRRRVSWTIRAVFDVREGCEAGMDVVAFPRVRLDIKCPALFLNSLLLPFVSHKPPRSVQRRFRPSSACFSTSVPRVPFLSRTAPPPSGSPSLLLSGSPSPCLALPPFPSRFPVCLSLSLSSSSITLSASHIPHIDLTAAVLELSPIRRYGARRSTTYK
uniref:Uncharacterized protein n=1 Tax=Eptatretus burgeri TaxID=7764 RepID=A0A8C4QI54_EPTBU